MKKLLLFAAFASFLSVTFMLGSTSPAQAYNNDNLISDQLFRDKDSMTKREIQSFLDARGGALATWSGGDAAQIIYDASQDFGISPKVIMATLQKEQSLITDPNPHHTQYNFAMGYGCPTTGSCSFPGFQTQVRNGTWQLRLNYERARGNNSWWRSDISYACRGNTAYYRPGLFPGNTVRFYDHVRGRHYATVKIANAATASMYCYTPHVYNPSGNPVYYSGSYNFVNFYERHWGSTIFPTTIKIKGSENPDRVYLVWREHYYHISSPTLLRELGFSTSDIATVRARDIAHLEEGPRLNTDIKFENEDHIYLVNSRYLHRYTSRGMFENTYNRGSVWNVVNYPASLREFFVNQQDLGSVVRAHGEIAAYAVEAGSKRYITSRWALDNLGEPAYGDRKSSRLSKGYVNSLSDGPPIIRSNTILRASDTKDYYLYDNNQIIKIANKAVADWKQYTSYSGANKSQITALAAAETLTLVDEENINTLASHDGDEYLIAEGVLRPFTTEAKNAWRVEPEDFREVSSSFISRFTIGEPATELIRINNGRAIYKVHNGRYHHITTRNALDSYGYSMSDVINIVHTDILEDGKSTLHAPGQLIRLGNTNPVYIVVGEFEHRHIPSREIFESYRFSFSEVRSTSTMTGYEQLENLGNIATYNGNTWLVDSGKRYRDNFNVLGDSGFDWNNRPRNEILQRTFEGLSNGGNLNVYVRGVNNPDPVFRIENGQKRQYSSRRSFENGNGDWNDIIQLSDSILDSFPVGDPI